MDSTLLGKATPTPSAYDPSLLQPLPRAAARGPLGLTAANLPFVGADLWTAHEMSWLLPTGKPGVAVAEFEVPADSPCLIESKSLKLYVTSLNFSFFASAAELTGRLQADLSAAAGAPVGVRLRHIDALPAIAPLKGTCIDDVPLAVADARVMPEALSTEVAVVDEALVSHLVRSTCPVTGQPDFASVMVSYRGPRLSRAGLLRYLISYRRHEGFHEQCVERMFIDIWQRARPQSLCVYARFTRRGGIDINPYRLKGREAPGHVPTYRQ